LLSGVITLSRIRCSVSRVLLLTLLLSSLPALAATSARKLAPNYRHWLEVEVPYIITSEERKQFLTLTSDPERDSFINEFWRDRNPDPNSDSNSYREEHYRRLAYANEHFGNAKYEDGWRTPMGRIYIVLGPPKQKASYHEQANLRPIELWFYSADNPALPPFFYVMFFKHSAAESWRIYSPTQDGPVALVTTGESQNDNKMALRFIRKSVGDEVAKATITLLPGEPADFDNFEPSMDSDMLLATINGLADNPLTKQHLEANRLRERVTTSILTGDKGMSIGSAVFRDEEGRETLSYLVSSARPDPSIVGRHADGSLYYDLVLRTSVLTPDGKPVYDQEEELTGKLTEAAAEVARKKIFAAEGRAPLAPGTYTLVATLTNNVNHVAARQQASVTVPTINGQRIGISELIDYGNPAAVPDPTNQLPFSASKVRFTPRAAQIVYLRAGEKLPLAFQLWLDPRTGETPAPEKVHLRYVFGTVTASAESPTIENEDIDAANRDKAGNLVSGHTVDTSTLTVGTYRLVVTATREGSPQPAYAAMTLHVLRAEDFFDRWTAYGSPDPGGVALDDLKRGLSAEAQGADDAAKSFYQHALSEGSKDTRPLERLAALLERHADNDELARLSQQPIVTENAVDPKTLVLISQALTKLGNPKSVVRMLEAQIKLQSPSANLYKTLADACEATGNTARARDLRSLATGAQ
jgi:GWxTD domain-containing protein